MFLLKRQAGAPLSDAEVQQRRDAARARWEKVGAVVAGAIGGAAGGVAAARHQVGTARAAHEAAREQLGAGLGAAQQEGAARAQGWEAQLKARRAAMKPWVVPAWKRHLRGQVSISEVQAQLAEEGLPLAHPDATPDHPFYGLRTDDFGPASLRAAGARGEAQRRGRELQDLEQNARPPRQVQRRGGEVVRRADRWERRVNGRQEELHGTVANLAAYHQDVAEFEAAHAAGTADDLDPPRPEDYRLRWRRVQQVQQVQGNPGDVINADRRGGRVRIQGTPNDERLRQMRRDLDRRLTGMKRRIDGHEGERLSNALRGALRAGAPATNAARAVLRQAQRRVPWIVAGGAIAGAGIGAVVAERDRLGKASGPLARPRSEIDPSISEDLAKRDLSSAETEQRRAAAKARWDRWRQTQAIDRVKRAKAEGHRLVYRGVPEGPDFAPKPRSYQATYVTQEKGHARDYAEPWPDRRFNPHGGGWITAYALPKTTPVLDVLAPHPQELTADQRRVEVRRALALGEILGRYRAPRTPEERRAHKRGKLPPIESTAAEKWAEARRVAREHMAGDEEAPPMPGDQNHVLEQAHVDPWETDVRGLRRMGYAGTARGRALALHDTHDLKPLYARHTRDQALQLAKRDLSSAETEQRRAAAKARWDRWRQMKAEPGVERAKGPRRGVIVHVNRQVIARNAKHGTAEPAVIIRRGQHREYAHEVELIGPSRIIYSPHKPLDCGARLWIEARDARGTVTRRALGNACDMQKNSPAEIAAAARATATPTPAQAKAGNYRKGRVTLHGLAITIETPAGHLRRGRDWVCQMPGHYGYFDGTMGRDGDAVDVTLGAGAANPQLPVFVIDQVSSRTGAFDEHKCFLGYPTEAEAVDAYHHSFADGRGPERLGAITRLSLPAFRAWLEVDDKRRPLGLLAKADDAPGEEEREETPGEKSMARALGRLFSRWVADVKRAGNPEDAAKAVAPAVRIFEAAARAVVGGGSRILAFDFESRNPRVRRAIDDFKLRLSGRIAAETREAVRSALQEGAEKGLPIESQARRIREAVAVSPVQAKWIANYRRELEEGRFEQAQARVLRDRRHDPVVARHIESGARMEADQIDKMVASYHRRVLAYRATTIARTEAIRAANFGQVAGMRAYLEDEPGLSVEKVWIATKDDRTRDTHRDLDGKTVIGLETPFEVDGPKGKVTIRWPNDDQAPADEVVNCRCTLAFRVIPKPGSGRLTAAAVPPPAQTSGE